MISLVFAAALLAAGEPAAQPSGAAASVKGAKASPTDVICKREAVLGSRMKERVCMTRAEWDQRKADSRAEVEKSQSVKPLTF